MRILWHSNAMHAQTGYGVQTALFAPRLMAKGHEVAVSSFFGLEGAGIQQNGMNVYPGIGPADPYGIGLMGMHAEHFQADVMISLIDAWVFNPKLFEGMRPVWSPWFPVDGEPLSPPNRRAVERAHTRIVISRFGERMVHEAGMDCEYVPHGYDKSEYHPDAQFRGEMREKLGLQDSNYLVGVVAANKGYPSRKNWPQLIAGYAAFSKQHPDARLYLHTTKGERGENNGVNLPELLQFHGVKASTVIWSDQYQGLLGHPAAYMRALYNAFDVFLLPSSGEGFGVPILEAQACGTRVIVGDWTAMPELCWEGTLIPKDETFEFWLPHAYHQYLVRPEAVTAALLKEAECGCRAPKAAAAAAQQYDADVVVEKYWLPVLERLQEKLQPKQNRAARRAAGQRGKKKPRAAKPAAKKRALVTYAIGGYQELWEIAKPSFEEFAELHGYDLVVATEPIVPVRHPSWHKLPLLNQVLLDYDEAFFVGSDIIITDPSEDVPIAPDAWQAVVAHKTGDGEVPNYDVWYTRRQVIPYMEAAWASSEFDDHGWWEQAAMMHEMGYHVGKAGDKSWLKEATDLYKHTTFLDGGWNVHKWDENEVRHPRLMHATMYEDRAEVMRLWDSRRATRAAA